MSKIIEYINRNSVGDMITTVKKNGKDPASVLKQTIDAGVEFTKKMVEFRHELEKLIEECERQ